MKVFVNDSPKEISPGINLASLLTDLSLIEAKGWAFAVNGAIIKKNMLKETILNEGDQILLIQATQGG